MFERDIRLFVADISVYFISEYEDAFYHVTARGNERRKMFLSGKVKVTSTKHLFTFH